MLITEDWGVEAVEMLIWRSVANASSIQIKGKMKIEFEWKWNESEIHEFDKMNYFSRKQ